MRGRCVSKGRRGGKSGTTAIGDINKDCKGNVEGNTGVIGALEEYSVAEKLNE